MLILGACAQVEQPAEGPGEAPQQPAPGETALPPPAQTTSIAAAATPQGAASTAEEILPPAGEPETTDRPPAAVTATSPTSTPETQPTASPEVPRTLAPGEWQTLPVIPARLSSRMQDVYRRGLELGNDPNAFSKIGDCGTTPAWFLGDFDRGPRYYSLGEYQDLEGVIQHYQGSFSRTSLAAKAGFNASSVLAPLWANRSECESKETPLACEYRVHNPSLAFITLGTNDAWHQEVFEEKMRQIIDISIEQGIVPILVTKADNEEGDNSINATIASLAVEYELPLWNYWLAVQSLPNQGLQPDEAHLTWGPNRFDSPAAMKTAWTHRNLTALQTLDAVWKGLDTQQASMSSPAQADTEGNK